MLSGRHFVVVLLDLGAHGGHRSKHLAAHVLSGILRRHREIPGLHADAVAEVAPFVGRVRVRWEFAGIEDVPAIVGIRLEADVVENEELGFRPEVDGIADVGGRRVGLRLLGDAARVAGVGLAGRGLEHVADDGECRRGEERVHHGSRGIGHQRHVRLVDGLPARDGRTVEHGAVGEHVLVDHRLVERHVLPLATDVGETQVDVLDVVVLDVSQDVGSGLHVGHAPQTRRRAGDRAVRLPDRISRCGRPWHAGVGEVLAMRAAPCQSPVRRKWARPTASQVVPACLRTGQVRSTMA